MNKHLKIDWSENVQYRNAEKACLYLSTAPRNAVNTYILKCRHEKNDLTKMTRNLCQEFEKFIAENIKTDLKAFWRYTNSKLKSRPKLGDLVDIDGSLTHDGNENAGLLNKFFTLILLRETPARSQTLTLFTHEHHSLT